MKYFTIAIALAVSFFIVRLFGVKYPRLEYNEKVGKIDPATGIFYYDLKTYVWYNFNIVYSKYRFDISADALKAAYKEDSTAFEMIKSHLNN